MGIMKDTFIQWWMDHALCCCFHIHSSFTYVFWPPIKLVEKQIGTIPNRGDCSIKEN